MQTDTVSILVTVTKGDLYNTAEDYGSVIVVTGTDDADRRITFAGDAREMQHFAEAVLTEGEATAHVESWQIRRVES